MAKSREPDALLGGASAVQTDATVENLSARVQPPVVGRNRSPLARLVKGSATYGFGRILQNGIGFLLVPIYTRYLTPGDYGIVAVTTAIASAFTVLFGMGLHGAVTRHYYDYRDDSAELRGYMGTVFMFFLAVGLLFVGGMNLLGEPVFSALLKSVPFHPYIELTLWTAFFTASGTHLLSIYRAREQPRFYIALSLLQTLFSLGGVLYFVVVLQRGALGKVEGGMWGGAIVFLITLLLMTREASLSFSREKLSHALAFGLPLIPHLVFGWMLGVADRIYLERMTTLQEVGLYSLGYQVGMLVGLVVSAINSAWVPIFYDTAKTNPDAPSIISRICTLYTAGVAFVALLLILAAPDLIALMADESYHAAGRVVPLVALAYVFQGLYFMSVSPLFYMKQTKLLPALTGLSAAVNVSANLLLVPRLGMMGAAWATLLSFAVLFFSTNALAQRTYHIPYSYSKMVAPVAVLAAVAYLSGFINELPWAASAVGRMALLILFICVLFANGTVDRQSLSRLVPLKYRADVR